MKALIWDVETSSLDLLIRQYDLRSFKGRHNPDTIVRDWVILGAAWKWLGDNNTRAISVKDPSNDYQVVESLHYILSQADLLIGHNSDAFDLKKFNTRAIKHGFDPIPPKKSVDTLKVARKHFRFTSNKLRYLANFLGLEAKDESPDWDKCIDGDEDELRYMRQYNRQDVVTTEQVYLKLRGYHYTHPDMNTLNPIRDVRGELLHVCPKCQSPNIVSRGDRYGSKGRVTGKKYSCNDCGGWHTK